MRVLGRFLLAAVVGIFVLLIGVFVAFVLGALAASTGPTEGGGAPGDGFMVLQFIAIGVLICVPLSIAAACWVLFRPSKAPKELAGEQGGIFLAS